MSNKLFLTCSASRNGIFQAVLIALLLVGFQASVQADTVSTSFEFAVDGTFMEGNSPVTATFAGGVAETRGNPDFYQQGAFAWHIRVNDTGVVTFETPANAVDFFFRNTGGGDIVVDVFTFTAEVVIEPLPNIVLNPTTVAFGDVQVGAAPSQTLTVSNDGDADLTVTGVSLMGSTDFTLTAAATPFTLARGERVGAVRSVHIWRRDHSDNGPQAGVCRVYWPKQKPVDNGLRPE
ncbi:MAG: choice-of-anchor D domain-containing protein [bacterium]|nr:choice-of-anchor D domain-containing protein [bacterium]